MAEATTEAIKGKPEHQALVAGQVAALHRLLEAAREGAMIVFVEKLIAARDVEWMESSKKTAEVYHKIGMLEAAKLICPVCAQQATSLLRTPPDEKTKAAAAWTHHPVKGGQPDKTIGTACTAAVIHETLEVKK